MKHSAAVPQVPGSRIRVLGDYPMRNLGYVLYWMVAARRTGWNFALQRAVEQARAARCGLVVLEPLRVDYPWASDRLHAFVLEGMADNARRLEGRPVIYYPYVEPEPGAGQGLLAALAKHARVVVTDECPTFFLRRMQTAAAAALDVRLEVVDSCGLLPLSATEKPYHRAVDFRRFMQRHILRELGQFPLANPVARLRLPEVRLPADVLRRWPATATSDLGRSLCAGLPIDHGTPAVKLTGGARSARRRLGIFLDERAERYADDQNHPDADATSGLSPYLHFGHISPHQVFDDLTQQEDWLADGLADQDARGAREGWWGMSAASEAFLDQLITWRELGFHFCHHVEHADRYETLPQWAQSTLEAHAGDQRPHLYSLEQFAAAETHDQLWNAAQRQLASEGVMHNYLRMLWGKKILEWTPSPRDAFDIMIELNNRFALDGRDPNSLSGISWVLGRFDRAWPERPIFGKVRFMTSESARRKLRLNTYLQRFGSGSKLIRP